MLNYKLVLQTVEEISFKSVLVEIEEKTLLDYPKNAGKTIALVLQLL